MADPLTRRVVCCALSAALAACGGGGADPPVAAAPAAAAPETLALDARSELHGPTQATALATQVTGAQPIRIVSLSKASETRIGRTVYEYEFLLTVANDGPAREQISIRLKGAGSGTTIVPGTLELGRMRAQSSAWPYTTVKLRHDRRLPFQPEALVWEINSVAAAPMPARLLAGPAAAPALAQLDDFAADAAEGDMAMGVDAVSGARFYARQLQASLRADASVAQVNAVLSQLGGLLRFSRRGGQLLTLVFPTPLALPALHALAAQLQASGVFAMAQPIFEPVLDALPSGIGSNDANPPTGAIHHHAALRLPEAWTLRQLARPEAVDLIVVDYFGSGPLGAYNGPVQGIVSGKPCRAIDPKTGGAVEQDCSHGYHVLGIAAGLFGGHAGLQYPVIGAAPVPLRIHVIDLAGLAGLSWPDYISERLALIVDAFPNARFVMNLSIGDPAPFGPEDAKREGRAWIERLAAVRPLGAGNDYDFRSRVLQVSAAGNTGKRETHSRFNAAAVLDATTLGVPRLPHALVVENRVSELNGGRVQPGCLYLGIPYAGGLWGGSTLGGHVGAVGSGVYSYTGKGGAGYYSGTSMASPQVAGLAGYMLALKPDATLAEVAQAIVDTAGPPQSKACAGAAPVVDALAAVLSLDGFGDPRLRAALLRQGGSGPDGSFSFADAASALERIRAGWLGTDKDFSTGDLNGDGFTSESAHRAGFDLDMLGQGAGRYSTKVQPWLAGTERFDSSSPALEWDETSVSDFDILCYYLNSPLFERGSSAAQAWALRNRFRGRLIDLSLQTGRNISCGAIKLDGDYQIDTLVTAVEIPAPIETTVPCKTPDGQPSTCRAALFCGRDDGGKPIDEVGQTETLQGRFTLDSLRRLASLGIVGEPELMNDKDGYIALDRSSGSKGKIKLSRPRTEKPIPRRPEWSVDYSSIDATDLDLVFDPETGRISGTGLALSGTGWSLDGQQALCWTRFDIRARPLVAN